MMNIFNINNEQLITTHRINPCSIPCIEYNSSLSIVSAPHLSKRIYHYQWTPSNIQPPSTPKRHSSSLVEFLGLKNKNEPNPTNEILPDFERGPELVNSISTAPLNSAATKIVSVAIHQDRIATVNRQGRIALYALNGTTAAKVNTMLFTSDLHQELVESEEKYSREDDDLSDGYDFVRSRLAMGSMGLVYGGRSGSLWWLDFGCR
ncbi:hypothetical protein G6F56_009016 [Rhizopus delemar]|uniref:Uncharacterized protein n=1 Tax=Rhizopus stolonifer TaxID=4846 RepID=A0A367IMG5_RHIST|nr:hypothetical protein G6F56_009016 [Rhizopus delemar]RCH78887.1 hypothetical protein CU098_005180 [Rhizopus stolonifer]